MKIFFTKLNYIVSTPEEGRKLEYFTISNRDGSPRWIFPIQAKSPLFLKFYHVEGFRSRVFAFISLLIFRFRLQHLFYKKRAVFLKPDNKQKSPIVNLIGGQWALFTGTAGPNNKMVLYSETAEKAAFFKIPFTDESIEIIKREFSGVLRASSINPEHFILPKTSLHENGILEIDDITGSGTRSNLFSHPHIKMLDEMYEKTAKRMLPPENRSFNQSLSRLENVNNGRDPRIPFSLYHKLQQLGSELSKTDMVFGLSHGDYTPWNMFMGNETLAVYDWELANETESIGFDAFHFIIQKGILIDRKPWKEIRKEIISLTGNWGNSLTEKFGIEWELCLKFYLFINISYHLELYSRQKEWHEQIHWLLQTWSEALTDLMADDFSARGMLIDDLFVILNNIPYATIKFPDTEPSALDVYTDIDICLNKNDAVRLVERLKNHAQVQTLMEKKSSFMTSVQIIMKNNDVLNLDLIWQFKWKHLEMMSTKNVLISAQTNNYGIKAMNSAELIRYLGLFYGLNGSEIPSKHIQYLNSDKLIQYLALYYGINTTEKINTNNRNQTREIHRTVDLSRLIISCQIQEEVPKMQLVKEVNYMPANRGLNKIINSIHYLLDTGKSLFRPKGIIITFSGVDGAGKSTVIEHIRKEFDKKLRKRVVVLRHRPSVLPILSAWTKGKVKAEEDAANTLPRQGLNRSFISSILRFAYYYTDYLAGQFVVYVRHVLRGDIVLYDRYYFDFINDSVRSNILLPEKFLRSGYFFLMKPDFNFFLYADADTILARKQELDKKTITELTTKYLSLFNDLDSGKISSAKYMPILNNELDVTIRKIMDKTTGEAA